MTDNSSQYEDFTIEEADIVTLKKKLRVKRRKLINTQPLGPLNGSHSVPSLGMRYALFPLFFFLSQSLFLSFILYFVLTFSLSISLFLIHSFSHFFFLSSFLSISLFFFLSFFYPFFLSYLTQFLSINNILFFALFNATYIFSTHFQLVLTSSAILQ